MHTLKRMARALVQRGFFLRPPPQSTMPEPDHQSAIVEFLIDSTVFPPRFVFGNDPDTEESRFLENGVVWDIVINAVVELKLKPHLEELDRLFCAAAAAVECALMELRSGRFVEMDFTFRAFEDMYEALANYISEHVACDPVLCQRWKQYKVWTLQRLHQIVPQ